MPPPRPDRKPSRTSNPTSLVLKRALLVFISFAIGFGLFACLRPLDLLFTVVQIKLRLDGIKSEFVSIDGHRIHYYDGRLRSADCACARPGRQGRGLGQPHASARPRRPSCFRPRPARLWPLSPSPRRGLLHFGGSRYRREVCSPPRISIEPTSPAGRWVDGSPADCPR